MERTHEPSRILRDLMTLENDFKYNLKLLKIRDREIERCSDANRALQEMQSNSLAEIECLKARIARLEATLAESEQNRRRENEICQQNVDNLTRNIIEMKRKHQTELEESRMESLREEDARAEKFLQLLREKEIEFRGKEQKLREKLEEEKAKLEVTARKLSLARDENSSLRTRLRELESRCTCETAAYKTEFKTMESSKRALEADLRILKDSFVDMERKYSELREKTEDLAIKCEERETLLEETLDAFERLKDENKELLKELKERMEESRELLFRNRQLTSDKNKLLAKGQKCTVEEHQNYDETLKQNAVLKELVKAMRKERDQRLAAGLADLKAAEDRLGNLEAMVGLIKIRMTKEKESSKAAPESNR